jgi:hypothetical protein
MNANSTRRVVVESGGEGVAPHVGLHALGCFADRIRLGDSLSACIPVRGERLALHDRGKVLVHTALMLAGGGESCADIEHLRAQEDLFGCVPSDSTVFRTFHEITAAVRDDLAVGVAKVRAGVWSRLGLSTGTDTVFLDIDASLVDVHSENKAGTGPTYKGGFGFHPLLCFADATGEALSGMLRPGNAGSNTVADHVVVLDAALAQLPEAIRAGHHEGDDPELVGRQVVVRTDAAGTTKDFLRALRARNVGFFTSAATNAQVQGAIFDVEGIEELWAPARCQNGELRQGAAVCELTELVAFDGFPDRTRLIVRREPLHPGAQRSLFPSTEYRYWGFYTDQDGNPVDLDVTMRAHAHVENHIARLKDSGLLRFPFSDLCANANWMAVVLLAADLVRWFQLTCLEGSWKQARPKALRWGFFHAPGRLVHRGRQVIVRILAGWPHADAILSAHRAIALIT